MEQEFPLKSNETDEAGLIRISLFPSRSSILPECEKVVFWVSVFCDKQNKDVENSRMRSENFFKIILVEFILKGVKILKLYYKNRY
jgi:hypothetical protein